MATPVDSKLYQTVKKEAKQRFDRWPSAYGSAWLVKEYKKRGGRYSKAKKSARTSKSSVSRWMREEWIQVVPYLERGVKLACGDRRNATKACRPLHRISEHTPITLSEVVSLHGKPQVLKLAKKKLKDMNGRLQWKSGSFHAS